MSRQSRASVNTCIVLGVSSAGSECIGFGRGGARVFNCSACTAARGLKRRAAMAWTIAALICCVLHAFGFSCSAAASLAESLSSLRAAGEAAQWLQN